MVDPRRLEALGITKMGFTQVAAQTSGGTPLYIAPEVIAGQPFTIAADIYALGVMLYQLAVGDLRKPLAPGWESEVGDELLVEDIALAAAGDPARRLADAAHLATRLRSLETRRQARAAETAARERAERAQRAMQELRRTRVFASALLVLAVAAIAGGATAYSARNDALAAHASTRAINDFLTDGVLSVDPAAEKPKDASYESLLNRAAAQVDVRFKNQPEAAASIHWLLGRRFQEVGHIDVARVEYEKASSLLPRLQGSDALPALLALDRLIPIYADSGRRVEAIAIAERLVDHWVASYGRTNLVTLLLRARVARFLAFLADIKKADAELRLIAVDLPFADPPPDETRVSLKEWLGITLAADISGLTTDADVREAIAAYTNAVHAGVLGEFAEDYRESEARYRAVLPIVSKLFGEDSEATAWTQMGIAMSQISRGQIAEARERIERAEEFVDSSLPPKHWLRAIPKLYKGRIELEQHSPAAAAVELDRALALCVEGGCPPRIAEEIQYDRGRAYEQLGQPEQAIGIFHKSLGTYELLRGPNHIGCLKRRISLADALRRAGRLADAAATLGGVTPEALDALPPPHLVVADHKRVQGLLWLENREFEKSRVALGESLKIFEHRLGRGHWRTRVVRTELAQVAKR